MDWREWISVQPEVCHGEPCCAGTRVTASVVLANPAAGLTADEILRSYPMLVPEHVPAVLAYAAELARVRYVDGRRGVRSRFHVSCYYAEAKS